MPHKLESYYHQELGRSHENEDNSEYVQIGVALCIHLERAKQPGVDFPLTAQSPGCVRSRVQTTRRR